MMQVFFADGTALALPQSQYSLEYDNVDGSFLISGDVEEGTASKTLSQILDAPSAPESPTPVAVPPVIVQPPPPENKKKRPKWVIPVVVTLVVLLVLALLGYGIYWYETNKVHLGVCEKNPCQNGGTCINKLDEYACDCADYFSGEKCQFGLRLGGDSATNSLEGRVEMFSPFHQDWEVVYDYYFDDAEAVVVCQQIGFYGGTVLKADYFGGSDDAPCRSDYFSCLGSEDYFQLCNQVRDAVAGEECDTNQAGVRCLLTPP